MRRLLRSLLALSALLPALAWPGCDVSSGPQTRALLELYTSEGCSSCPPADAWVSDVSPQSFTTVPLTLHVPYWDELGWKDPYAQQIFADRQQWLVHMNHGQTVYTPHMFVAGSEVQDWQRGLVPAIASISATPAQAAIHLQGSSPGGHRLDIDASVTAPKQGKTALFLVVTEGDLHSKVERGENAGREFRHRYVAREWMGPFAISKGALTLHREITLPDSYAPPHLGVVAFVQDMGTGEVLQALSAYQCM